MKFNCDAWRDASAKRSARNRLWHLWFAWYPVKVAERDCRWLENVERREVYYGYYGWGGASWEYRAPPEQRASSCRNWAGECSSPCGHCYR